MIHKEEFKSILPYLSPTEMLKFFNLEPVNRALKGKDLSTGGSAEMKMLSVNDYLLTIPSKYLTDPKYAGHYHNTALKIVQKLVAEGLLSTWGDKTGIYQQFQGNSYDSIKAHYNSYDFLVYGFAEVVDYYRDAVRLIEIKYDTGDYDIGTGFAILYEHKKQYLITAKHCLPKKSEVRMKIFLGFSGYANPIKIYCHNDDNVDIAIIEFSDHKLVSDKFFILEVPRILDRILVCGYPPIPGTTEPVLVSSTGEITAIAKTYFHTYNQIYVNANIKGGSSGSPIINEYGSVIGVVIESPRDIKNKELPDELRFGTGLPSTMIFELLESINKGGALHNEIAFTINENESFRIL